MLFRILAGALGRQRKRSFLTGLTMALGISLATAMLVVVFGVSDKVNRELKAFGANIVVTQKNSALLQGASGGSPRAGDRRFLADQDIGKLKTIFWANNIVDFAPFLEGLAVVTGPGEAAGAPVPVVGTWFARDVELPTGESVRTGIEAMRSWWTLTGTWIEDCCVLGGPDVPVLVGKRLAGTRGWSVGDRLAVATEPGAGTWTIQGIFDSGGADDDRVFVPLPAAQALWGLAGKVDRIEVSAITTPENDLARQAARNPKSLSAKEWDTWYCTAYVGAITFQIEEVLTGARAKAVRQVTESEGTILKKTQLLMLLITLVSLIGTALGISNLVSAGVLERSREIGLMKALGATDRRVAVQLFLETAILGVLGGAVGYGVGVGFAQVISWSVFGSGLEVSPVVPAVVALMVALVTLVGCLPATRGLLTLKPAEVLHGR